MKKSFAGISALCFLLLNLSGCNAATGDPVSPSLIYGFAAILSLLLLIGCILSIRPKQVWFLLLFSSVLIVNTSYTLLSVSGNLEMALLANRFAYFGSVFLPLAMLMIVLDTTNTNYHKHLPKVLLGISGIIFVIAASPGISDIYYKDVSLAIVHGASILVKEYGPLHSLYLYYLLGYFGAMILVIIRAQFHKTIETTAHAIMLAIAVFVNIGVWFIGQLTDFHFEFLSISYIISEMFLLGDHLAMVENRKLKERMRQIETVQNYTEEIITLSDSMHEQPPKTEVFDSDRIELFLLGLNQLTPTERVIYDAHIARMTTKEILADLNIKENTLKYHNRNLYGKLGVSSKNELLEIHKQIRSVQTDKFKN